MDGSGEWSVRRVVSRRGECRGKDVSPSCMSFLLVILYPIGTGCMVPSTRSRF